MAQHATPNDPLTTRLGHVRMSPQGPVTAGATGEWTIVYTVGAYGVDEGGTIKIAQRFASDWDVPQFTDPAAPAYATVVTDGQARLRASYQPKAHERPWMKCLVIDVYDGSLAPGDTITLVLGDRSGGSPGTRAQTFVESSHEFRVLVDPTNACRPVPLPTSPRFPIVAGPAVALRCVLPMQARVGDVLPLRARGEDAWGNPTPLPGPAQWSWEGDGDVTFEGDAAHCNAVARGQARLTCGELSTLSNPITVTTPAQASPLNRYWGDLHAQSDATVGTGDEIEYFTFARDHAFLDFASHQGNDFQMTDDDWRRLNEATHRFHEDGRFVVFPGYEWSANTTAGGDRNVWYLEEGMPIIRSSHWQIPQTPEDELTPAHPVGELFSRLRQHVPGEKVLMGSHVGGRYADLSLGFDAELGPLIEVQSCWGQFEWLLWDAFDAGHIVGVMCNSDGHKGRPGAEGPGAGDFGVAGGLTCVLAESLTRTAIFSALKARRCYGTTGARMGLAFTIDEQPMGSVLSIARPVALRAQVHGESPMEELTLYRGREPIHTIRPAAFQQCAASPRIRVSWRGARIRGRGRRAIWDGQITVDDNAIESAATVAFDTLSDGILDADSSQLTFRSRTTGDTDGIDLILASPTAGRLRFDSPIGYCAVALANLGGRDIPPDGAPAQARSHDFPFGGVDMAVTIERYPIKLTTRQLSLDLTIDPPANEGPVPYFIKARQEDGHAAWSSPIYLKREG